MIFLCFSNEKFGQVSVFLYSGQFRVVVFFIQIPVFAFLCNVRVIPLGMPLVFTLMVLTGACWLSCLSNKSYHEARSVSISDSLTENRHKSSDKSFKNASSIRFLKNLYVVFI